MPAGCCWRTGGCCWCPGTNGDLVDCRVWDPATDTYTPVPDLNALPSIGQGAYLGGCVLVDGRVVFAPYYGAQPGGVGAWVGGGVWAGYCAGGVLESPAVR